MNRYWRPITTAASYFILLTLVLSPTIASAHCDGLDGPVVTAARQALNTGDVKFVLIWVRKEDEREITLAFSRAMAVRRLGSSAKELADLYFFETLVRVHRAGEGAPYTGLQPAGRDLGPAIPAADHALDIADSGPLLTLLKDAMNAGLSERFHQTLEAKRHATDDVEAGRRYVAAYVQFIHYVEDLHKTVTGAAPGHFEDDSKASIQSH